METACIIRDTLGEAGYRISAPSLTMPRQDPVSAKYNNDPPKNPPWEARGEREVSPGLEGILLDAYPHKEKGLELAIATENGIERITYNVGYRIYLRPINTEPKRILQGLEAENLDAWIEEWLLPPWYTARGQVIVLESSELRLLTRIASILQDKGLARRVNNYPGPHIRALWSQGLVPGTRIQYYKGSIRLLEDPRDPLYPAPSLRIARIRAYTWHGPVIAPWEEPREIIVECCGERRKAGNTSEALDLLDGWRPHIVDARISDRWSLPLIHRPGWYWYDPDKNLVSPWGLLEWMRVSSLPYREAHGAPIGKILTAAEAREAYKRRYLVDPSIPRYEKPRPVKRLVDADMAGAARIPRPGLYWNIIQLDYSSLYPSLISIHNISAETVNNPYCGDTREAPFIGHKICVEPRGLVSKVLGELVRRRQKIKEAKPGDPRVRERSEALKWILVSGFGYLGYRNSLFGSISAYETVTVYARRALAVAEEIASRYGYRVIHAIVDSIFLEPRNPSISIEELAQEITRKVGVRLRIEAHYKWLYIPSTMKGTGAVNKYYGSLREGGIKLRGIMAIRRDTPPLIARSQRAAISLLAGAETPAELEELSENKAAPLLGKIQDLIESGEAPLRLLVIKKKLGDSERQTPWRRASRDKLVDYVKYIMTPRGPWPVWRGPPSSYDKLYYLRLLCSMLQELPSTRTIARIQLGLAEKVMGQKRPILSSP